jgi:hypothetical protein
MRKLFIPLLLVWLFSCDDNDNTAEVNSESVFVNASADGDRKSALPEIRFDQEIHDFGKITQGERVTHSFTFVNAGKSMLIVSGASASCGCTVPGWPREPIAPGEKGKIDVVFSSEGKSGYQEKTITVITNCEPATRILRIKAEVVVPQTAQ